MPPIERPTATSLTLQTPSRIAMMLIGDDPAPAVHNGNHAEGRDRKRCTLCPVEKKVILSCQACRQPVYSEHSIQNAICE